MQTGALDVAERELREATRLWRGNGNAWHDLAVLLKLQHRWPDDRAGGSGRHLNAPMISPGRSKKRTQEPIKERLARFA
ncbi:MAG TPA: hypothetical protein VD838_12305 [Anaeromyxobacteraceae bacterium]|nr:hypothetical protein [Anaeromyxobacteraceae bacterium]